jgi:hypothetical protein
MHLFALNHLCYLEEEQTMAPEILFHSDISNGRCSLNMDEYTQYRQCGCQAIHRNQSQCRKLYFATMEQPQYLFQVELEFTWLSTVRSHNYFDILQCS